MSTFYFFSIFFPFLFSLLWNEQLRESVFRLLGSKLFFCAAAAAQRQLPRTGSCRAAAAGRAAAAQRQLHQNEWTEQSEVHEWSPEGANTVYITRRGNRERSEAATAPGIDTTYYSVYLTKSWGTPPQKYSIHVFFFGKKFKEKKKIGDISKISSKTHLFLTFSVTFRPDFRPSA